MKKIVVALPIYKDCEPDTQKTIDDFTYVKSDAYRVIDIAVRRGSPNVYYQRYNLAMDFLKTDGDYYLYFDGDQMLTEPQKSIECLVEANKDIISPIICRKVFPHLPTCRTFEEVETVKSGGDFKPIDYRQFGDKPFRVYHSCGGVVLIKRKVIEAIKKPFFPRFDESGDLMGVDCSFFKDAADLGFQCWVDPRINCGHIGKYTFTLADYYGLLPDLKVTRQDNGNYLYELRG
jgi:hypothetical protein